MNKKAEDFSWKLYPDIEEDPYGYPEDEQRVKRVNDFMAAKRFAVVEGYEQGVKDTLDNAVKAFENLFNERYHAENIYSHKEYCEILADFRSAIEKM